VVARDLRITLGQLPAELRETVRHLRVFGNGEGLDQFVDELGSRAKALGLEVELVKKYAPGDLPLTASDGTVSSELSLAARLLAGEKVSLEFLPPKISAWKQVTARYSSGKLAFAGAAAGAVLLLVAGAFMIQQWQLSRWRSAWKTMKPRVTELENMQQEIRRFRPWFDDSFRCLSILRKLTEAFPEDGSVSATRVEIRDPGVVTCSGTARDQQALFKVVDKLKASKEISSAEVENIRGKQFALSVRWAQGGAQ
jgi:hypothetical protein